jgi:hypothetical protein
MAIAMRRERDRRCVKHSRGDIMGAAAPRHDRGGATLLRVGRARGKYLFR